MSAPRPQSGQENPYEAPESDSPNQSVQEEIRDADADRIRKEYLTDELLVRVVGGLGFLLGALPCLAAAWLFTLVILHATGGFSSWFDDHPGTRVYLLGGAFVYILIGAPFICIGLGLWNLHSWVRFVMGLIAGLSLFFLPYAIVIVAPFCFLLFSEKSRFVCSPEYRDVVQATSHIRFSIPLLIGMITLSFIVLLTLVVLAVILFIATHSRS